MTSLFFITFAETSIFAIGAALQVASATSMRAERPFPSPLSQGCRLHDASIAASIDAAPNIDAARGTVQKSRMEPPPRRVFAAGRESNEARVGGMVAPMLWFIVAFAAAQTEYVEGEAPKP